MKKVFSIHLDSKVFQIEEDAYTLINGVMSGQWKKEEFEAQLAEALSQKLNSAKTYITYPDTVDALYQLGVSTSEFQSSTTADWRSKRLYRQPKDKMIAGICTGLGEYFGIDPVIARILFVISLFMFTMGFWLYVILWIIVPKAPIKW